MKPSILKERFDPIQIQYIENGDVSDLEIMEIRKSVGWDNTTGPYSEIRKNLYVHFVARYEGELVGFIDVLSDGISDGFLQNLIVHPNFQNKGIGKKLVLHAITRLRNDNVKCIQVTFSPHLEKFYEAIGFHIFRAGIIDRDTMKVPFLNN